jgi:hypothetical protein
MIKKILISLFLSAFAKELRTAIDSFVMFVPFACTQVHME